MGVMPVFPFWFGQKCGYLLSTDNISFLFNECKNVVICFNLLFQQNLEVFFQFQTLRYLDYVMGIWCQACSA